MDLWLVFITGLTVGGLTCLAVQGGLLAAMVAKEGKKSYLWPTASFLTSKLIVYTILGFLLGLFGSALTISDTTRIIIQLLAGGYMLMIAFSLLGWVPANIINIRPPQFLANFTREKIKERNIFAPALLGITTIFIPCGTTLAMEVLAISSGSPILGALTMGIFVLGTTPVFLGAGFLTARLRNSTSPILLKLASLIILYLGLVSINGGLILANSPITLQTLKESVPIYFDLSNESGVNDVAQLINGEQIVNIFVSPTSYTPNYVKVQSNLPVKMSFTTSGGLGCTSEVRIPALRLSKRLPVNGTDSLAFTPTKKGKLTWTCSMGMYSGVIEVI